MRIFEDFFDEIEDVNVSEETEERNGGFMCTVTFVKNPNDSYIRHCIENMSSAEIENIEISKSGTIFIDFNINEADPCKLIKSVVNFLVGLWQGLQRNIYEVNIGRHVDGREIVIQEVVFGYIIDLCVNPLDNEVAAKKNPCQRACHDIARICHILQTSTDYDFRYGAVMEVLQLSDYETMNECVEEMYDMNRGYSTYAIPSIYDFAGAKKFETTPRVLRETIDSLLKQKMKLSFYAYNNSLEASLSEYDILKNKVDDAINHLTDHDKLFSMKKIIIDLVWFRYMHNKKKGKTIVVFPIGLFYRAENTFTNKSRFTQYFLKIEYKDAYGEAGRPENVKFLIDMLKTNKNKKQHILIT